jgi:hypothetical protein
LINPRTAFVAVHQEERNRGEKTDGRFAAIGQPPSRQVQNQGRFAAVINRQVVKFKTRAASRQLSTVKSSSSKPGTLRGQFSTAKPSSSKPVAASRPVLNGQTVKFKTNGGSQSNARVLN